MHRCCLEKWLTVNSLLEPNEELDNVGVRSIECEI